METGNGSFNEWRNLILKELDDLGTGQKNVVADMRKMEKELREALHALDVKIEKFMTEIATKAAIKAARYGALVGFLSALAVTIIGGIIVWRMTRG